MVPVTGRLPARPALVLLTGLLLVGALLALRTGPMPLSVAEVWQGLFDRQAEASVQLVVRELRLPRLLLAMLVGAALGVSGALLQGLFRNPLADPGLIGISSGAALGAVAVIVLGERVFAHWNMTVPGMTLPLTAFVCALLTTAVIWRIGSRQGETHVAMLLLAGIAINAIAMAGVGVMTFIADDGQLRTLTFWTMGSLAQADWRDLRLVAPWIVLVLLAMPLLARALNAVLLGESVALHLGHDVDRLKRRIVVMCALAVGAAVSVSGLIGFVGLVAPHLVRLTLGVDHRTLLPASALLGAVLLVLADTGARLIVAPAEFPIGLMMALLGGPFFLALLMRRLPG